MSTQLHVFPPSTHGERSQLQRHFTEHNSYVFFYRVASFEKKNLMSRVNLATVFGPVLLSGSLMENPSQEKFRNVPFEIRLVEEMMTYYQWLFDVSVYYILTL